MKKEDVSDEAVSREEQSAKSNAIIHALLIGFLIGIVIYSVAKNSFGFLMLIPLYFVYKLLKKPKGNDA